MDDTAPDDADFWPFHTEEMARQLAAAGIPKRTIFELVNSSIDVPEIIPIVVDWLRHIDERVPADSRVNWRAALLRNLISKHTKGDPDIVDLIFAQFEHDPPLQPIELEAAGFALERAATKRDFARVAELLRSRPADSKGIGVMVQWLGRVKTPEATALAVEMLAHPGTRAQAMQALVRQKATGVRDAVAVHLDDEHAEWRKLARKTLDKLPPD